MIDQLKQLGPRTLAAIVVALLVLAGVTAERLSYASPEDAEPYHQRVAEAANAVPRQIGPWLGTDTEVTRSAVQLLRPNAIISRKYIHQKTGERVNLMIVHCKRARDMGGHYPPICYPANGWEADRTRRLTWRVRGDELRIAEYTFARDMATGSARIRVLNTLVLPGGTVTTKMDRVRSAAADYQRRIYGAGQFQLIFPDGQDRERRKAVFARFYKHLQPVVKAIRSGPIPKHETASPRLD